MFHQHLLARAVARVHGAYLRQRNVRFVHHQQKILGEVVYQRKRSFTRLAPCQMARIVFDAGAVTHFVHHFKVVIGTLLQTLRLQQLVMRFKVFQPLFKLHLYIFHRAFQILTRGYIVRRRKNSHMRTLRQNLTRQHVNFQNALHFVVKHFNAHGFFVVTGGDNLNYIAAHAEGAALKGNVVTVVLNFHQLAQNRLAVNNLSSPQRKHHIIIFLRRAQTVNARYAGNDNNVAAFKQRAGRRVAQFINLIVDGSVLFNVGIALRNVSLRLIIIIIGNKIFHRVIRKEGFQLAGKLRRQRFVVRYYQSRLAHAVDNLRNGIGFARARRTQQHLRVQPLLHALRQGFNRLRLVACRFKRRFNFKIHN